MRTEPRQPLQWAKAMRMGVGRGISSSHTEVQMSDSTCSLVECVFLKGVAKDACVCARICCACGSVKRNCACGDVYWGCGGGTREACSSTSLSNYYGRLLAAQWLPRMADLLTVHKTCIKPLLTELTPVSHSPQWHHADRLLITNNCTQMTSCKPNSLRCSNYAIH